MNPKSALLITKSRTVRECLLVLEGYLKDDNYQESDFFIRQATQTINEIYSTMAREGEKQYLENREREKSE